MLGPETGPALSVGRPPKGPAAKDLLRHGGFRGVRVGEASLPGPPSYEQEGAVESEPLLVTLNCGGSPGAWRALRQFEQHRPLPLLALQEVGMLNKEVSAFQKAASRVGWCFYHQAGAPTRVAGATLFRKEERLSSFPKVWPKGLLGGVVRVGLSTWLPGWASS